MTIRMTWLLHATGAVWMGLCEPHAVADPGKPSRSRVTLTQALPALDGNHLTATITEVTFEPGEVSASHSHPCPVIVHMIEGAIRSQVQGEPEAIYRAGQTFFEAPNGVHAVAANASRQVPARFIAITVCDHDGPLIVPTPPRERK
jgi:quercetin dioxygenase-like cupin family protein